MWCRVICSIPVSIRRVSSVPALRPNSKRSHRGRPAAYSHMRVVLQHVGSARVRVDDAEVGQIGHGLLVFVGVGKEDGPEDVDYMVGKIRDLRILEDEEGKMNRSVVDAAGDLLVVSQFTLYGDCRRGRRPSFDSAAPPDHAHALYDELVVKLRASGLRVETGQFQAMMDVELVNVGPVTILLDSKKTL